MLTELVGWCLELPITSNSIAFIGRPVLHGRPRLTAATLLVGGSVILPHGGSLAAYKSLMNTNVVDFAFLIPDRVRELIGRSAGGCQQLGRSASDSYYGGTHAGEPEALSSRGS